jgi:geranyl-CoA carboxylase beta subunit
MATFESRLDTQSAEFKRNREVMLEAVEEFRSIERTVIDTAESKAQRYVDRGYLPPRERLARLLDPGMPFLELSTLCGYLQDGDQDGSAAGGSVISGIGYIAGTRCLIMVDDYLTKGGSISPSGGNKRTRMQDIAMREKLPLVTLAQSGGGNLLLAGDTFGPSGRIFANQCRLSAAGVPQITVVHGSATAGGAYQPGLSDYIVLIRQQSTVYLAGPPLLKAATGEIATDEEIGGAEMHTEISGLSDYIAENDGDGVRIAREITRKLGWNEALTEPATADYREPLYSAEELLGVVPDDPKMPYDVREIIARIADGSDFLDFKPGFDEGTICGHMEIHGLACGVIGNNAPITARGAAKSGQFYPDPFPAQYHRLYRGYGIRARRHYQARLQVDPGGDQQQGAKNQCGSGWLLRGRQLRHVRSRYGPPVHVRLASLCCINYGPGTGRFRDAPGGAGQDGT